MRASSLAAAAWFAVLVGVIFAAEPAAAQCGGFCIYEIGTPAMGRSAAGATAAAQDASTAFENPAGMTRLEKGGTSLGLYAAWFDTEFDADVGNTDPGPGRTYTNDGGNAGGFLPGLGNNLVVPLADELGPFRDLRFGFGVAGLFGGAAQYADDWVGRNFITDINMVILDVQPSLAVSVTDWLSIGVGMNILHAELAEFQLILPNAPPIPAAARGKKVKADGASDWQTSFTVGMLLEPWEGTRIGGGVPLQERVDPQRRERRQFQIRFRAAPRLQHRRGAGRGRQPLNVFRCRLV